MEENNKDTIEVEEEKEVEETTEKTYTQEDLDNSFNAGRKKASKDWQKDEKYKEFMEWKKTNQNDSEKIADLQASNESLKYGYDNEEYFRICKILDSTLELQDERDKEYNLKELERALFE